MLCVCVVGRGGGGGEGSFWKIFLCIMQSPDPYIGKTKEYSAVLSRYFEEEYVKTLRSKD